MKPLFEYPIGIRIDGTKLTPLMFVKLPRAKGGNRAYLCKCDCGKETTVSISDLRLGKVKSCRCGWTERAQNRRYTLTEFQTAFFAKVNKGKSCWIWTAYANEDGYGITSFRGRLMGAHRASWIIHYGDIPEDMRVLHHCDNPPCVNPEHLFLGTQLDNMRDCAAKGRIRSGEKRGENNPISPLKNADVFEIRRLAMTGRTRIEIAKEFGVCRQSIDAIVNRETWTHI